MRYSFSELVKTAKELDTPLIIYDSSEDEGFVVMGIDSYKKIKDKDSRGRSKNKDKKSLLDEINKNISLLIKQQKSSQKNLRAQALKKELKEDTKKDSQFINEATPKPTKKEVESKIEYDSINEDTQESGWRNETEIEIEEVEPENKEKSRKNIPYQDQD